MGVTYSSSWKVRDISLGCSVKKYASENLLTWRFQKQKLSH